MHALGRQTTEASTEALYAEIVLELQSVFAAVVEKPGTLHCGAAEKTKKNVLCAWEWYIVCVGGNLLTWRRWVFL